MFARFPPPDRADLLALAVCIALGALGCVGLAGPPDPVTELAWLALLAPAAGAGLGARGLALFPFGLVVPGSWSFFLVLADAASERDLATPAWSAAAVGGLFALGLALGRLVRSGPVALAGLVLFAGCVLVGLPLGFGLGEPEAVLARQHPGLAALFLDLSPLVLVFDCGGYDWLHANDAVYARSGVEWIQRRPWPGHLAGPVLLLAGVLIWAAVERWRRVRPS